MRLLIDGYNLLHATDLFGAGELAGTLRGSREALLGFLADRLSEKERQATVIVFDAADAPPGLPDRYDHAGMNVRFARGYPDADSMIEDLLEGLRRAKQLTVVSGDRRVQRAARSVGAKWVDSSPWFTELCRRSADQSGGLAPQKPAGSIGSNADWVAKFGDPDELRAIEREAAEAPLPRLNPPVETRAKPAEERPATTGKKKRKKRRPPLDDQAEKPRSAFGAGLHDLFPPGYAEDLLEDPTEERPHRGDRD